MLKYGDNNIGKVYLGSNSIGKAYYGSNLVYQKGASPSPTTISYIRNTSCTEYINTGITADSDTHIIVWARNFNPASTVLCGSRTSGTSGAFGIFAPGVENTGALGFDFGATQNVVSNAFLLMSGYHKYELDGNLFYVDDVLKGTATAATFSNSLNIFLFAINTNGTADHPTSPIDICACKIYKNNELVRDFTAVNSPSIGLYDSVSETLFTNAGSGSFSYGSFNENAYTPLEYIVATEAQYFDTGANVTYDDVVVCKFRPTGDTKGFFFLFGTIPVDLDGKRYGYRGYLGNSTYLYRRFYVEMSNDALAGSSLTATQIYDSTNPNLKDADLVYVKRTNNSRLYKNNSAIGTEGTSTQATSSFVTPNTLYIGCGDGENGTFVGRLYYFGIGSKRALVPAKKGSRIGMYDTYNDVFYTSDSGTPFTEPII